MTLKSKVIEARQNGLSYRQISEKLGVAKSTVADWVKASGVDFDYSDTYTDTDEYSCQALVNPYQSKILSKKLDKFELEDFLSTLAPIKIQGGLKGTVKKQHNDFVIVAGDLHFPTQCKKSIGILFETIRELKPKTIILNGDTLDMLAISRYPKDIRHNHNLLEERVQYQQFLKDLIEIADGASIIETDANHSGNGTDGRWFRYLSERIGELACLPEIAEKLSYANIFLGDLQEHVTMCDYVSITDELVAIHGDVVRKHGGYSARGMLEKYNHSLIMGHTHRLGMTCQRLPGLGFKKEKQLYAYEMGCLCDLKPVYASAPNWQNGFGIVAVSGSDFGVEPVLIQDGKAVVTTLGKTIKV